MAKVTSYVDDLSLEAVGTEKGVEDALVAAGDEICYGIGDLKLRLSKSGKCITTASKPSVGRRIAARMTDHDLQHAQRVKSLGVGMAGGSRRNARVQRGRLAAFVTRVRRIAALVIAAASALPASCGRAAPRG